MKTRVVRVAGTAVGAVIIGAIAVVAMASTLGLRPSANAEANDLAVTAAQEKVLSAVCKDFMTHFATEIGKSEAEVNAAFQRAIADTLADEVKAGHLTQAQADTIKQRLANRTPCSFGGLKPRGAQLEAFMQQYLAAAASALGITEATLRTDLRSGQNLSQIAASKNVSEATFRSKVVAAMKTALDKAVANKRITTAQEDAILNRLRNDPLPLWNKPLKRKPAPATSPSPKTAA